MLRRLAIVLIGVGIVGGIGWRITHLALPVLELGPTPRAVGVFHVRSDASGDSTLTLDSIAAAARAEGLDFVVVTDRNSQLPAPITIDGVTLLSYAELSTPLGHVVQLGGGYVVPKSERQGRGVLNRIRSVGGVPILAHPGDPKRPWRGDIVGAGGVEIASFSASLRRRAGPGFVGVVPAAALWRIRRDLVLAQVYDRDVRALEIWDGEYDPGFIGLCAADAQGQIDLRWHLRTWQVVLEEPLPDPPDARAAAILEHLTQGRFHCVAGVLGRQPRFIFRGVAEETPVVVPGGEATPAEVEALESWGPVSASPTTLVLLRNGQEVMRSHRDPLVYQNPAPGTYRIEVRADLPHWLWGQRNVTVVYSNRIRVRENDPALARPVPVEENEAP